MIKATLICRSVDGLILCEAAEYSMASKQLQETKHNIKKFQKEISHVKTEHAAAMRQIESTEFGIFAKQSEGVTYTAITDLRYPPKLANLYLDSIMAAFADELRATYSGVGDFRSRLETIENSHHFIRFDRVIKQKKLEYQDVQSSKNLARMKSDLQSIKDIVRVNLDMINGRTKALEETEERARKLNEDAKKFRTTTKQLAWTLWFKRNLFWFVLAFLLMILVYFKFM